MKKCVVMALALVALASCGNKAQKKDKFDEALDLYDSTVVKAAEAIRTDQDPPEIHKVFQDLVPILEELDTAGTDAQKARMHEIANKLRYAVKSGGQLPADAAEAEPTADPSQFNVPVTANPAE